MTARGSRFDWVLFVAMGFFWGSSYVFINTGLDHGPQPFTLIMFRLAIGFVLLASVVAYFREPLPAISLPGASSLFGPNGARDRIGADDRGSPNSVSDAPAGPYSATLRQHYPWRFGQRSAVLSGP
jgi:hypothetical protein